MLRTALIIKFICIRRTFEQIKRHVRLLFLIQNRLIFIRNLIAAYMMRISNALFSLIPATDEVVCLIATESNGLNIHSASLEHAYYNDNEQIRAPLSS